MPHTDLEVQLASNAAAEENLVTRVLAEGIEYIYYQFVTLNGRVMAKVVPARHIQRNLQKGVQFHGSAVADLASNRHGQLIASGPAAQEFVAIPDSSTFATLPWDPTFARMFCNLYRRRDAAQDAGTTLPTCVRGNLMRVHRAFRDRTGYELRSGTEPEMSWFGEDIAVWSQPNVSPAYHFGALETMRPIVKQVMSYASALGLDMIEGDYEDTSSS
jgi:glutamine synthetase